MTCTYLVLPVDEVPLLEGEHIEEGAEVAAVVDLVANEGAPLLALGLRDAVRDHLRHRRVREAGLDVGAAGVHDKGRRRLRHRHLGALTSLNLNMKCFERRSKPTTKQYLRNGREIQIAHVKIDWGWVNGTGKLVKAHVAKGPFLSLFRREEPVYGDSDQSYRLCSYR